MAKGKKELTQEENIHKQIASTFSVAERNKWKRRHEAIMPLIVEVQRMEKKIIDLQARCQPLYDEIAGIRAEMVDICIHDKQYIVITDDGLIECKFCNKKLKIINNVGE